MVTRYFNDEVHEFRRDRFNGRGHGYPLSHDRDLSSGPNKDHTEDIFGPPLTDAMVKVQRWNQIPRSPDGGFQLQ